MKTAIKLVLIDLVIAQIVAPVLIMIPCTIYLLVTTGNLDKAVTNTRYSPSASMVNSVLVHSVSVPCHQLVKSLRG